MSKELLEVTISDRHRHYLEVSTDGHLVDLHDPKEEVHIFEFNKEHIDVLKKIIRNLESTE
ncbi:hypothetical protein ACFQ75_21530 [Bacillus subtilis]